MESRSPREAPWKPRTRATAIFAPRYGSSPAPSMIRPQRASRQMSSMGAKVQCTPAAAASVPATRAEASTASRSQLAASPRGTGKIVRKPWITSYPKIRGIPRRLFSTASSWVFRVASAPMTFSIEPTRPLFTCSSRSLAVPSSGAGPVTS